MSLSQTTNKIIRCGFYVKHEKWIKMHMDAVSKNLATKGIEIIPIDLEKDLKTQGPFDIIIHKSIDLFVRKNCFSDLTASKQLETFINFCQENQIPVANPFSFDDICTSRKRFSQALSSINFENLCLIPTISPEYHHFIIKPELACGANEAHVFIQTDSYEEAKEKNDSPNFISQPLLDTNGIVAKVYCIGSAVRFNIKGGQMKLDEKILKKIADKIHSHFGCDLFGFDLIRETDNPFLYLIDLNSFSGIEALKGFEDLLANYIIEKVNKIT